MFEHVEFRNAEKADICFKTFHLEKHLFKESK